MCGTCRWTYGVILLGSNMSLMAEHLDAETVAAFSAQALSPRERSRVFDHLAECDRCREWVAVNAEPRKSSALPSWCLLAAAGISCLVFAGWLTSAHPAGEPLTSSKGILHPPQIPITSVLMEPYESGLPEAMKRVRLAPDVLPIPSDHVSLKTTVGEKWIKVDVFR